MIEAQRFPNITLPIQIDMSGETKNFDLHCHRGLVLYKVEIHLRQGYKNFPKINSHLKIQVPEG